MRDGPRARAIVRSVDVGSVLLWFCAWGMLLVIHSRVVRVGVIGRLVVVVWRSACL